MAQAIKPDAFVDFRSIVNKTEIPKDELEASEVALAHLENTDGWLELKKYIDTLKKNINNLNKVLMEKGAAFEEIGRNAVVSQLAVDLLDQIVTRVDDAREAVDRRSN